MQRKNQMLVVTSSCIIHFPRVSLFLVLFLFYSFIYHRLVEPFVIISHIFPSFAANSFKFIKFFL